jgi:hypothetical protein
VTGGEPRQQALQCSTVSARTYVPHLDSPQFPLHTRSSRCVKCRAPERLRYFLFSLVADSSPDLLGKFRWNFSHAVGRARVLRTLLQDFLFGFTASYKVTIHSNISATDNLCHGIVSFRDGIRLREFARNTAGPLPRMTPDESELPSLALAWAHCHGDEAGIHLS